MKVVYIAGKYRGPNTWAICQNIRAAEEVAACVWAMGLVALCPHKNTAHMDGVTSDEVFLEGTMELLRRCDAVVLVPNWRDSAGARAEVEEAWRRLIPVFGEDMPAGGACPDDQIAAALEHLRLWVDLQVEAGQP